MFRYPKISHETFALFVAFLKYTGNKHIITVQGSWALFTWLVMPNLNCCAIGYIDFSSLRALEYG